MHFRLQYVAKDDKGKIIDRDYKKTAASIGFTVDKVRGDDLTNFPIEVARLRSVFYFLFVVVASTAGYGWAIQSRTHLSVPLIMQFLCGLATTGAFNVPDPFPHILSVMD